MRKAVLLCLTALAIAAPSAARKKPTATWQVSRTGDPVTGATSCIVAAYDQAAGISFSRTGVLYPFVENSSTHGVLVGVSSGGKWRMPTGDILWRVDERPFRTLRAADNPPGAVTSAIPQDVPGMQALVDQQLRIVRATTATSTVASGETAQAMLKEMVDGTGLLFRAASATQGYGLPGGGSAEAGMITKDGLRPIPLEASFREGLASCGIHPST